MPIQVWAVLGAVAGLVALLLWAKHQGKLIAQSINEAVEAEDTLVLERKSNEVREAAAAARDSGSGVYGDDRLSTTPFAPGDYRD